ncbi:fungal specific transcription factor domain-containing [Pyrenophora seminiperda CCB06]|uniref:Fungal specific transcription factor domain-containing n=1 Tax=Pyrenophora seminiperda CCB06 TaxID=1302712 RepID=A0A3M7MIX6_9PLEO|nr:fungal specific transcription factor domain-containing [Pyrenophora seminiperda CCB06]
MAPPLQSLDHLILFLPLDPTTTLPHIPTSLLSSFTLTPGGHHADGATSNTLILLADGCYIELISFCNPSLVEHHWWGPDPNFTGWKDWCLTNALPANENQGLVAGSYADPIRGGRQRPDGVKVEWDVTFPHGENGGQRSRGRLPFFCHDITPREVRVPIDEEKTTHVCGALGVKELSVIVDGFDLMPDTWQELTKIVGENETIDGSLGFSLGRVKSVESVDFGGAELVLKYPGNEVERKLVAKTGFWFGDVVLFGKAGPGKAKGTKERLDAAEGEDGVGGLWIEYTTGDQAVRRVLVLMGYSPRSPFHACLHDTPLRQLLQNRDKGTECNEHVETVTREVGHGSASFESIAASSDQTTSEIKCSGGLPRCNYCEKTDKPCVYERPRRDRLATAKDRNQALVSVLKELSLRVSDDDKRRIEHVLQDSDEEVESPASMSSSSRASAAQLYQQHSRLRTFASSSSHVPFASETSPTSDQSPLPRLDGIVPEESCDEEGGVTENYDVVEAGFLGQISEVQWLQSLRSRVQAVENVFVGPVDVSTSLSHPISPAFATSPTPVSASPAPHVALTNYYLDDDGIELTDCGNPFELPPEPTADILFHCFGRTVQAPFPLLPATLQGQLKQYYKLVRDGQAIHCPERWFALVNLVFAIGAKFSHLVQADWRAEELDHVVYLSRAFQLLNMNDTILVLSTPDLSTTQAAGLFAIYYMTVGHVNRAWVMVGIAMRSAFSLGLHIRDGDFSIPSLQDQSMVRTWWSLHALESLLSSITGRPSIIPNENITTPLPSAIPEVQIQDTTTSTDTRFLDADANLNLLTQQVISDLYTQRRSSPSWDYIQQTIVSLVGDLDKWAVDCIPQFYQEPWNPTPGQQREVFMLKLQYYRLKILTTRPSLRRIERCYEAGNDEFNSLDQSVADMCIQAAQDVASLLAAEPNPTSLYEKGPWWCIVHNIMQSIAVLMNAIACAGNFYDPNKKSATAVRQLISWLRGLRETNNVAARAYQVVYSIVKTSDPNVWVDIADIFPNEMTMVVQQPASSTFDAKYMPWPGKQPSSDALFRYELDNFGNLHFHLL